MTHGDQAARDAPEDPQEVIARVQAERGFRRKWHAIVARYDPGMLQRHHENVVATMALPALSRAVKELIIVGIDAANFWPGIKVHIVSAVNAGATWEEVAEAILTAGLPGGPHAVVYGMEALDEVRAAAESSSDGQLPEL